MSKSDNPPVCTNIQIHVNAKCLNTRLPSIAVHKKLYDLATLSHKLQTRRKSTHSKYEITEHTRKETVKSRHVSSVGHYQGFKNVTWVWPCLWRSSNHGVQSHDPNNNMTGEANWKYEKKEKKRKENEIRRTEVTKKYVYIAISRK